MKWILQVFCILLSAVMLSLGIPNELFHFGSPLYGAFSLIFLYIVYSSCSSWKESFLYFGLHALIVHLISSYWLAFFKDFAAFTLGASALGTAAIEAVVGIFFYLPFSKKTKLSEFSSYSGITKPFYFPFKIFWFASCYTAYEWCKSCGFLGYPWGTVSTAMYKLTVLTQIADITGTYGITFLTATFSGILGESLILLGKLPYNPAKNNPGRHALFQFALTSFTFLALIFTTFVYGSFRLLEPRSPVKYVNAILVQQNADPWKQASDDETILLSQKLTKEKIQEAQNQSLPVDIVVWSEGCLKYSMPRSESHYKHFPSSSPLIPFMKECGVPFLLGGSFIPESSSRRHYNGALLFDSEGRFCGAYGKNHLVPFAEVIPFADIPAVSAFLKKVIGISAGWTPGSQYVYFDIPCQKGKTKELPPASVVSLNQTYSQKKSAESEQPLVRMSSPICFDDAFPDVTRPLINYGSELFMNITDDSWSMTKSAEYQHFVTASFRTIETRSTLARSCNSGYSVVIDPRGKIVKDLPLFEECAMFVQIPVYKRIITVYQMLGNWLPKLCVIFILGFGILFWKNRNLPLFEKSERKKFISKKKKKK